MKVTLSSVLAALFLVKTCVAKETSTRGRGLKKGKRFFSKSSKSSKSSKKVNTCSSENKGFNALSSLIFDGKCLDVKRDIIDLAGFDNFADSDSVLAGSGLVAANCQLTGGNLVTPYIDNTGFRDILIQLNIFGNSAYCCSICEIEDILEEECESVGSETCEDGKAGLFVVLYNFTAPLSPRGYCCPSFDVGDELIIVPGATILL